MSMKMDYCVAIRTLGTAGEKYQRELDSLMAQTIKPHKILVYIAEGYPLPKETVGVEEYIKCPKGMVAQRALPFNEVDTPLCLFLDDDVYLPPTAVEKLIESLIRMGGDCVAADTYKNQDMPLLDKLWAVITNWALPRFDDKWAFKIGYTGTFSYNGNPKKDVYLSQSAAGPCSLWRLESFRKIHYEDELWMDKLGFVGLDDLLYFQKLYRNGGKLLVHYTSDIIHLDAQSARSSLKINSKKFFVRSFLWFVVWWRIIVTADDVVWYNKVLAAFLFFLKLVWDGFLHLVFCACHFSLIPLLCWIKGLVKGIRYIQSKEFKNLPGYVSDINHISH